MDDDVIKFGELFRTFMRRMSDAVDASERAPLRVLLDAHLEVDSSVQPVITEEWPKYDHPNVQVAMSAYLSADGRSHSLVGLTGSDRRYSSLADLISHSSSGLAPGIGSVELVNLAVDTKESLPCVGCGLFLIDDRGQKLGVLMRGPNERGGQDEVTLEVIGPEEQAARDFLAGIRRLILERNVFRRKVVSFGDPGFSYDVLGPVEFHTRPNLARDDLVLPKGVIEQIERQVFTIARHQALLRDSGQHVKRGLLLHGPPGNGKTLTVRYLIGRMLDHTVVLLTGRSLSLIRPACVLARALQPALIVLEDVDLVAEEREADPQANPVLFELLNEMDGVAEDADVIFVLTTNRADLLEPALAARPGRVDLAVDIGPPGADARRRLFELYGRGLELKLDDVDAYVSRTADVSAAFIKELMRKAALRAAEREARVPLVVEDADLGGALDELLAQESVLTRALLGAGPEDESDRPRYPAPGAEDLSN